MPESYESVHAGMHAADKTAAGSACGGGSNRKAPPRYQDRRKRRRHAHLSEVLLHKLAAHHADERGGGVVRHRLGQHGLAGAGRAVQQHAPARDGSGVEQQRRLVMRGDRIIIEELLLLLARMAQILQSGCPKTQPTRCSLRNQPGRVDAKLPIEVPLGQRQLHGLPDLLLLNVIATDVL